MTRDDSRNTLSSKIKSVATLVAAIAALVTSVGVYFKPPDTAAAQKSYEVLISEIKTLHSENERQHDMIMSMRSLLDQIVFTRMYSSPSPVIPLDKVGSSTDEPITLTPPDELFGQPDVGSDRPEPFSPMPFDQIVK